jgi:hypothetical protein
MSYRNQTGGPDGSIALARGELDDAAGLGASCGLAADDLDAYMNAKP